MLDSIADTITIIEDSIESNDIDDADDDGGDDEIDYLDFDDENANDLCFVVDDED